MVMINASITLDFVIAHERKNPHTLKNLAFCDLHILQKFKN